MKAQPKSCFTHVMVFCLAAVYCLGVAPDNTPAGHAGNESRNETEKDRQMQRNPLTPEEEHVIVHKGTERPFTGKYNQHDAAGTYVCKWCSAELYTSEDKFASSCGWPSFDSEIPGAVRREPDADGRRTEILCAGCGGHLGHVFEGEGLTNKNVRHCVNSVSLNFVPRSATEEKSEQQNVQKAVFAGGCFWGMEYHYQQVEGVLETRVGFSGGKEEFPSYEEVCAGTTGHAEVVEVTFDSGETSFEELARLFFEIHDPTQVDRQGPDWGAQYRSVVYYHSEEQRNITESLIAQLKRRGYEVATKVEPAVDFWEADRHHQDYYQNNGKRPYCHSYVKRF